MILSACSAPDSTNEQGQGSNVSPAVAGSAGAAPTTIGVNPEQLMPSGIVAATATGSTEPTSAAPSSSENGAMISNVQAAQSSGTTALTGPVAAVMATAPVEEPMTEADAFGLLQQATFGASEAAVQEVVRIGPKRWLAAQFVMPTSTYSARDRDAIHKWTNKDSGFCDQFPEGTERNNCWRDWYSSDPLKIDFFKQASVGTDQLRQRLALALSQILVVSGVAVEGTYGLADYFQMLRDQAFGNYRDLLLNVTLHPAMGQYLNMVNNDAIDPNENYAREMLQLFTIGTCALNPDGSLLDGKCLSVYNSEIVRSYAYALTGWTFPVGGVNPWCSSSCGWENPTYLKGRMIAVSAQHDKQARTLLSNISLPANRTAQQAVEGVVDSLMAHPNTAPFISKQLIQFLVSSNPSYAYIGRVANAFRTGRFAEFGSGRSGDLQATIAAILLDPEARAKQVATTATSGKMREPIVMMVNAVRALNGYTDGERMGLYGYGSSLSQPAFNSPSVFNFYSPDNPLPGAPGMVAPQLQLVNANTVLNWVNYSNELVYWWYNKGSGLVARADMANTTGTQVNWVSFERDAADAGVLVDRLSKVMLGRTLPSNSRTAVINAVQTWTDRDTWLTDSNNQSSWQRERAKTAAYLILSSPHFQVQL